MLCPKVVCCGSLSVSVCLSLYQHHQDQDFSCSFSDSLSLSICLSISPILLVSPILYVSLCVFEDLVTACLTVCVLKNKFRAFCFKLVDSKPFEFIVFTCILLNSVVEVPARAPLSVPLPVPLSLCPSACPSVCHSTRLSLCLSACPSAHFAVTLCACARHSAFMPGDPVLSHGPAPLRLARDCKHLFHLPLHCRDFSQDDCRVPFEILHQFMEYFRFCGEFELFISPQNRNHCLCCCLFLGLSLSHCVCVCLTVCLHHCVCCVVVYFSDCVCLSHCVCLSLCVSLLYSRPQDLFSFLSISQTLYFSC